jgi:ribosome-associated toxin RatA of RatAB toxin-antitoxin module
MMRTVDQALVAAPIERVFPAASEVERWPALLPHYRWVKMLERTSPLEGIVEMAAYRPFGVFDYPTWWVSKMTIVPERHEVLYTHIRGVTTGMDVVWRLTADGPRTKIDLIHEWNGPNWPFIRRPAAEWVIGPIFVHGIATRTLAGIKRYAEQGV